MVNAARCFKNFMSISKIKLQQAKNLIDDMIADLELELSDLKAAKKNLVNLEDKLNNSSQIKPEETSK